MIRENTIRYHDACHRHTRDAIGDSAYLDAFRHGHGLPPDDAIAQALEQH